jgi:hypothetical protein
LAARLTHGKFFVDVLGTVALGCNDREVTVGKTSRIAAPGLPPLDAAGGLYTIGRAARETDQVFAVVSELRLNVGCQVTECARVFAGYSVMCWANVVRPGGQIVQRVDPAQLPPALVPIPPRAIPFRDDTLWLHGFNIGVAVSY